MPADRPAERITGAVVDLRHKSFKNPSTILHYEAKFDSQGTARLTLDPGDYSWMLLQHEDFYLTPVYSANYRKQQWLRIEPGRNQNLNLEVHRKVEVRGPRRRSRHGKTSCARCRCWERFRSTQPQGWDDPPPDEWSLAGWGESDEQGEYTIDLAAGNARVSFQGNELLPERDYYELSVAAGRDDRDS